MDLSKKRKTEENGGNGDVGYSIPPITDPNAPLPQFPTLLSPEDIGKILDPLAKEQLLPIIHAAVLRHPDVLETVRSVADSDPSQRKLFVRGLGWETNTDKLRAVFSAFGELEEAIVITDKNSGKSKGYGFVTFKHIDAAILALKEPNKKIDGRITVTQLASAGNSGHSHSADISLRKIYVGNIPFEISSEKLLSYFSMYGEIEEGPLGFDKQTGKAKGFAFFVYKTEEGAKASLVETMKNIDGHQVVCKLATDNKKIKQQPQNVPGMANLAPGEGNYSVPGGGFGGYGGYSGPGIQQPQVQVQQQSGMIQAPQYPQGSGFGGYGQVGGQYGGTGGATGSADYGSGGGYRAAPSSIGMPTSGGYAETGNYGAGGGYRVAPSSIGMPTSGGYTETGNYGLTYPAQMNQQGGAPRVPPGGMYQGMPPYY